MALSYIQLFKCRAKCINRLFQRQISCFARLDASALPACHYKVLEVSRNASKEEIRDAYLKKSKELHPDRNPDDEKLHEEFIRVTESYNILKDNLQRAKYDNSQRDYSYRTTPGNPFGGFSDPRGTYTTTGTQEEINQQFYTGQQGSSDQIRQAHIGNQKRSKRNKTALWLMLMWTVFGTAACFWQIFFFHNRYTEEIDRQNALLSKAYNTVRESAREHSVKQSLKNFVQSHRDKNQFPGLIEEIEESVKK